jgi:hypothetical protein
MGYAHRAVNKDKLAHPTRFERVTFAFGGQRLCIMRAQPPQMGTTSECRYRWLRIPDLNPADSFEPQLTVIAQPCEEIGRSAAKILLERIKKPDREPKTVRHKTEFIIRNS